MKDNFKAMAQALSEAGFITSLESTEGKHLDFKFTAYSLNSRLSFRFENMQEFTVFLSDAQNHIPKETQERITAAFLELGLDPNSFFYINFFEKGKEEEM